MASVDVTHLRPDQRDSWEHKGYVILDDPCEPSLIEAISDEVAPLYQEVHGEGQQYVQDGVVFTQHPGGDDSYRWHRVKNAWKLCDSVRAMALSPPVLAIVEELFGRGVLPFQTLNFPVGTQQPPHFDSLAFNSDPPGFMCGAWVALEDMDMSNGPLQYYPGSHKLPAPTWSTIDEVTGRHYSPDDFETLPEYRTARSQQCNLFCQKLIQEHGFEPEYATIRKGQALIWAPNLIHGGAVQTDQERTRNSQVTHYYFEGCRYYPPMLAEPDHVMWEYPEWIRDPVPEGSREEIKGAIQAATPPGSTVLIAGADPALMELEGRRAEPFPQNSEGAAVAIAEFDGDLVAHLAALQSKGAEFIAFPKWLLGWLQWDAQSLQSNVELERRAVLRDGAYGAVYALDT
jgi:ectoine hydroxylase-related dioxygenase (phytanoyl-CoA dioxygenase family)